jgi:hypothetical protein
MFQDPPVDDNVEWVGGRRKIEEVPSEELHHAVIGTEDGLKNAKPDFRIVDRSDVRAAPGMKREQAVAHASPTHFQNAFSFQVPESPVDHAHEPATPAEVGIARQ